MTFTDDLDPCTHGVIAMSHSTMLDPWATQDRSTQARRHEYTLLPLLVTNTRCSRRHQDTAHVSVGSNRAPRAHEHGAPVINRSSQPVCSLKQRTDLVSREHTALVFTKSKHVLIMRAPGAPVIVVSDPESFGRTVIAALLHS